jgi:hypothetical protein
VTWWQNLLAIGGTVVLWALLVFGYQIFKAATTGVDSSTAPVPDPPRDA